MSSLRIPVGPDDHVQGNENAVVTLVEYGDYQCPYCGEAYPQVKQLQAEFPQDLRFVFRNFPITQLHPNAASAAATAEFAASNGHFWEAHDALYENQEDLGAPLYVELVSRLGLDPVELRDAIQADVFDEKIRTISTAACVAGSMALRRSSSTRCASMDLSRHCGTSSPSW
ncbi:DsbA family protein [Lysobacter sp. S4-A87]|uniref:DsbA family protein n=1 Tax=Lysobacter sp. S4-A87 TaxID=2925843 RepID=UPI001F536D78|nr:thioredoxin domain-containing protein [Lysobacter sp. S4-A87]UNK49768.1 DsbA family protein [Lysobacter sp. S4-A87]